MINEYKEIISAAEDLGWTVTDLEEVGFCVDSGVEFEFGKYSPAGEDFSFTVGGESVDELIEAIKEYSADFSTEEHVEMWIKAKRNGMSGTPSIRELIEDAEDIENMLRELSEVIAYGKLPKVSV